MISFLAVILRQESKMRYVSVLVGARVATLGLTRPALPAVKSDKSCRAWGTVVDRLLASPKYGERYVNSTGGALITKL
jgi:hypothetical protein